jgi:hypothetical protein
VSLLAAAVCPHPPLIVPELAAGAAAELAGLRAACDAAVTRLIASDPDELLIVGGAAETVVHASPYRAAFGEWGVPVEAWLDPPRPGTPALPLSVAVGVWLVSRAQPGPARCRVATVDASAAPAQCARWGQELTRRDRVALLVLGDGSACRGIKAPGYVDERAEPFDATVTKALAAADPAALLALDPLLAAELMVAGRAPWQVLAGAAAGAAWSGEVTYDAAPYGVQYTVASWDLA